MPYKMLKKRFILFSEIRVVHVFSTRRMKKKTLGLKAFNAILYLHFSAHVSDYADLGKPSTGLFD